MLSKTFLSKAVLVIMAGLEPFYFRQVSHLNQYTFQRN